MNDTAVKFKFNGKYAQIKILTERYWTRDPFKAGITKENCERLYFDLAQSEGYCPITTLCKIVSKERDYRRKRDNSVVRFDENIYLYERVFKNKTEETRVINLALKELYERKVI